MSTLDPAIKYFAINLGASFVAGLAAGYTLQKSGIPYQFADLGLEIAIPLAISGLEMKIAGTNVFEPVVAIASGVVGWNTFEKGDLLGRYIANLV